MEDGSVFHQNAAALGNLPGTAFAADELKLFHWSRTLVHSVDSACLANLVFMLLDVGSFPSLPDPVFKPRLFRASLKAVCFKAELNLGKYVSSSKIYFIIETHGVKAFSSFSASSLLAAPPHLACSLQLSTRLTESSWAVLHAENSGD